MKSLSDRRPLQKIICHARCKCTELKINKKAQKNQNAMSGSTTAQKVNIIDTRYRYNPHLVERKTSGASVMFMWTKVV